MSDKKFSNVLLAVTAVAVLGAAAFWLLRPADPPLPPLPPVTIAAPPQISAPVLVASAQGLIDKAGVAHTAPPVKDPATTKNVLLLYSYGHGSKGIAILDDSLLQSLSAGGFSTTQLFFEHLDLERNIADPQYRTSLRDLLDRKYRGRKIDLIVTVQQPALNYLLNEGRSLAEGAPAITVQAPMPSEAEVGKRRIVSMLASFDIKGTLERALELFPDTRRVVFVAGASEADRNMSRQAASITQPWQGRLEFEYTTEISLDAMLKRVASLPPKTIIIFTQFNRDASGKVTVAYEVEAAIIKAANAPVFGLYDFNLVNGGIGGSVISVKNLGQRTGTLALDLLHGRQQLTQPVSSVGINTTPLFDWEQIKRWGGKVSGLPSNTVFVNRVPTFWEQYRLYVIGVGGFVVAQSFLIAALLISGRKRRLTERSLQESEENLSITLHSIGDAVIATDKAGRITRMNPQAERLTDWPLADALGQPLTAVFRVVNATTGQPVADPVQLVMAHGQVVGLANHTVLLAKNGQEYQIADSAAPIRDAADRIVGVVLVFSDVTEKYRAEVALRYRQSMMERTESMGHIASFEWEVDTDSLTWSPEMFRIFGRDPALGIPNLAGQAELYTPQSTQALFDAVGKAIADGTPYELELMTVQPDGTQRPCFVKGFPERDASGRVVRVAGLVQDITERKQAEAHHLESEKLRRSEQATALETQRQSALAALSLMEDALTAQRQAEAMSVALNEQLDELRRWQQVTLGRESRILSVKKEVNELLAAQGQPPRYPSAVDEGAQK